MFKIRHDFVRLFANLIGQTVLILLCFKEQGEVIFL